MIRRLVLFKITLSMALTGIANEAFNYPGGVAQLIIEKESEDVLNVKFGLSDPVIMEYSDHWRVLIGLNLQTLPGEYVAYVKPELEGASGHYEKVVVKQHTYPFTEYSELDDQLASQAALEMHEGFSDIDFSNTQQPALPLIWPAEGAWSNDFGHTLYDQTKSQMHTPNAIVFTSTKLITIRAPQRAIVSKIKTSESGISTVFLDHGRGLYSILSGLSDLTVEPGNGIVSGAVLGKLGKGINSEPIRSGANEQKLVWQTVINDTYVNPYLLTKLEP